MVNKTWTTEQAGAKFAPFAAKRETDFNAPSSLDTAYPIDPTGNPYPNKLKQLRNETVVQYNTAEQAPGPVAPRSPEAKLPLSRSQLS